MFEIHIERDILRKTKSLYIFEKTMMKDEEQNYIGIKDGHIISKTWKPGDITQPFLELPLKTADELFSAIADAFNGLDLKTNEDIKIQGTLNATRDHLKDLQKLLNLSK